MNKYPLNNPINIEMKVIQVDKDTDTFVLQLLHRIVHPGPSINLEKLLIVFRHILDIYTLFINMSKENSIEATHWVEMNLDGFYSTNSCSLDKLAI